VNLVGVLEERVTGLVDRYRGVQKGAEELRSRLDAAEADISALHARIEEADNLRGALRERIQLLIDQVRRLEEAAGAAVRDAGGGDE
jgi:predicted nuclease with TOPRIM domain